MKCCCHVIALFTKHCSSCMFLTDPNRNTVMQCYDAIALFSVNSKRRHGEGSFLRWGVQSLCKKGYCQSLCINTFCLTFKKVDQYYLIVLFPMTYNDWILSLLSHKSWLQVCLQVDKYPNWIQCALTVFSISLYSFIGCTREHTLN